MCKQRMVDKMWLHFLIDYKNMQSHFINHALKQSQEALSLGLTLLMAPLLLLSLLPQNNQSHLISFSFFFGGGRCRGTCSCCCWCRCGRCCSGRGLGGPLNIHCFLKKHRVVRHVHKKNTVYNYINIIVYNGLTLLNIYENKHVNVKKWIQIKNTNVIVAALIDLPKEEWFAPLVQRRTTLAVEGQSKVVHICIVLPASCCLLPTIGCRPCFGGFWFLQHTQKKEKERD